MPRSLQEGDGVPGILVLPTEDAIAGAHPQTFKLTIDDDIAKDKDKNRTTTGQQRISTMDEPEADDETLSPKEKEDFDKVLD